MSDSATEGVEGRNLIEDDNLITADSGMTPSQEIQDAMENGGNEMLARFQERMAAREDEVEDVNEWPVMLGSRVFLQLKYLKKSAGNILLVEDAEEKDTGRARVLAVGPDCKHVKPDDVVVVNRISRQDIDNALGRMKDVAIILEQDIHFIVGRITEEEKREFETNGTIPGPPQTTGKREPTPSFMPQEVWVYHQSNWGQALQLSPFSSEGFALFGINSNDAFPRKTRGETLQIHRQYVSLTRPAHLP